MIIINIIMVLKANCYYRYTYVLTKHQVILQGVNQRVVRAIRGQRESNNQTLRKRTRNVYAQQWFPIS